ncbi:MAG: hypothetical protein O2945_22270 [Planctomycetota bacterium]|nr:hypothetical protein [Planctomycetota bacterium]MDA0921802.1 hypothetical protein [Planctomycetota bacterium]
MADNFSDDELLAFLDEQLPVQRASSLEVVLRDSSDMRQRLAALIRRRDQGGHTIGEIWRRNRLSCPTRTTLGSHLLGVLDDSLSEYVEFHLKTIGCRLCNAVVTELEESRQPGPTATDRRQRYFESSAGMLRRDE